MLSARKVHAHKAAEGGTETNTVRQAFFQVNAVRFFALEISQEYECLRIRDGINAAQDGGVGGDGGGRVQRSKGRVLTLGAPKPVVQTGTAGADASATTGKSASITVANVTTAGLTINVAESCDNMYFQPGLGSFDDSMSQLSASVQSISMSQSISDLAAVTGVHGGGTGVGVAGAGAGRWQSGLGLSVAETLVEEDVEVLDDSTLERVGEEEEDDDDDDDDDDETKRQDEIARAANTAKNRLPTIRTVQPSWDEILSDDSGDLWTPRVDTRPSKIPALSFPGALKVEGPTYAPSATALFCHDGGQPAGPADAGDDTVDNQDGADSPPLPPPTTECTVPINVAEYRANAPVANFAQQRESVPELKHSLFSPQLRGGHAGAAVHVAGDNEDVRPVQPTTTLTTRATTEGQSEAVLAHISWYEQQRKKTRLYADPELQGMVLALLASLLISPHGGELEELYCHRYPLANGKKVNVLYCMRLHVNHHMNTGAAYEMAKNAEAVEAMDGTVDSLRPLTRLIKLLCCSASNSLPYADGGSHSTRALIANGAFGSVYRCSGEGDAVSGV